MTNEAEREKPQSNEQRFYDALKRITRYEPPERLRKSSDKHWGLPYADALEMAYENMQQEAKSAILNKRRPR